MKAVSLPARCNPISVRTFCQLLAVILFLFVHGSLGAQEILISEMMATGNSGLADEDGEAQDWIELFNPRNDPVSLAGWHLTDDPANPSKWTFPAVTLPPRGVLVVFASDKDRRDPAGALHTNFKLAREGDYLALVRPDGITPAFAFAPQYPPQFAGISYGLGLVRLENLFLPAEAEGRLWIPADNNPGNDWIQIDFDDTAWPSVTTAIGYEYLDDGGGKDPPELLEDVTQPGDFIVPTSQNSPGNEGVEMAIDDDPGTKYLNFDKLNAGLTVTPTHPTTVVVGVRLTSANDAPDRDPTSFTLTGSDDGVQFTEIAAGAVPDFPDRFYTVEILFENNTAYRHYRLLFPTVRNAAGAVAVQIAEVEFLGYTGPPPPVFEELIRTDVGAAMFNRSSSAYLRLPFQLNGPHPEQALELRLRYDDGLIAYLNGTEVFRHNVPTVLSPDAVAPVDRPQSEAVQIVRVPMDDYAYLLRPGANVLAIQALNDRSDSPDFLVQAELAQAWISAGSLGYFDQPTPGELNPEISRQRVAEPAPNLSRGFYLAPIEVRLSCPTLDSTIAFTTDGTVPTADTAQIYGGPILIDRTTPLRAVALRDGWIPSPEITHTYLFVDDAVGQDQATAIARGFPSSWGATAADYAMDQGMVGPGGDYAQSIRDDLRSLPSISLVMEPGDLFGPQGIYSNPESRGDMWERPVSIEFIDPVDLGPGHQVNAGVRIQGGAFRRFDLTLKKSFRIVFREDYGPTTLRYPLFGPEATDRFDNFILRANSNDAWPYPGGGALYVRDAFAMESMRAMGQVSSHTGFAHLYINGLYWGLYNPVERPDAAFSATYHGGEKESWDAINQDSVPDGNRDAWNRLLNLLSQIPVTDEVYQQVQGNHPDGTLNPDYEVLLDVDDLIDYMILNFYIGNSDWPHRNYWVGRNRDGTEGFQFYPWDSETALGMTGLNADRTDVSGSVAQPYAALRSNAAFRMRFADRVYRCFSPGGAFYVNPLAPAWDPSLPDNNLPAARFAGLAEMIEGGIAGESARWGDQKGSGPFTRDNHWINARDNLLAGYFPQRSAVVLDQFRNAGLYSFTPAPAFGQSGGSVPLDFQLTLSAPLGDIFYTTDGSDPYAPVDGMDLAFAQFVDSSSARRVLVPSPANGGSSLDGTWHETWLGFDDSSWTSGQGGVGYDTGDAYDEFIQMDVETAMYGQNASAFIRVPFIYRGSDLELFNSMTLRMRYEDGFVAYLNGAPIASANAPADPAWNATATGANDDASAIQWRTFDVSPSLPHLVYGRNLLAIHGLNISAGSSDFLINVELEARARRITSGEIIAQVYDGPVLLDDLTTVKARALNGSEWSPLIEATFVVGNPQLLLSELHYHPADPDALEQAAGWDNADDFEFLELYNGGDRTFPLTGVHFVDGIEFAFPSDIQVTLAAGEFLLLVKNREAFELRYGTGYPIAGEYGGRLANSGERIAIADPRGNLLLDLYYGTLWPWSMLADGLGPSLERVDPDVEANPNLPAVWLASPKLGGTPGWSNYLQPLEIHRAVLVPGGLMIEFFGRADRSYALERCTDLGAGEWDFVADLPTMATSGMRAVETPLSADQTQGFFRLGRIIP